MDSSPEKKPPRRCTNGNSVDSGSYLTRMILLRWATPQLTASTTPDEEETAEEQKNLLRRALTVQDEGSSSRSFDYVCRAEFLLLQGESHHHQPRNPKPRISRA